MTSDAELLTRYAANQDEAAFTELLGRHLDHVYSTALRLLAGDTQLAEDVAQAVFTDLARRAASLRDCPALSGFLHSSARYAAIKAVRGERRRRQREGTALAMNLNASNSEPNWDQIRPFLDQSIGELDTNDRDALLLRYFDKKPFAEIGTALGFSENAARMRVDRALDKLRARLVMKGITSTAATLSSVLAQEAVSVAPAALRMQIASRVLAARHAAGAGETSWLKTLSPAAKFELTLVTALVVPLILAVFWPKASSGNATPGGATQPGLHATQARSGRDSLVPRFPAVTNTRTSAKAGLELVFVDAQSGLPITNQTIGLRGWERGSPVLVERLVQLDQGRGYAPFDPAAKPFFWILTRVGGYADTRLRWQPNHGEVIPESYTVRLVKPALIHGLVVDAAGRPVAGAKVGFNTENFPGEGKSAEDHGIDYLTAMTDSDGRWQIDRIAPDMTAYLSAGASHPEHAPSGRYSCSRHPELVAQLLDGSFIFRLGESATVQGYVVDAEGRPISNATLRVGQLGEGDRPEIHTAADGSFRVKGCRVGKGLITADAEGFAPAVLSLNLEANMAPIRFTLGTGKTLRLRVVNKDGQPIAGTRVWYNIFGRRLSGIFPQVVFQPTTDAEGRVVWEHAPDQDLEFETRSPNYIQAEGIMVHPDDQEHIITLTPALVVAGTVRDADTEALLPRFRLHIGYPESSADGKVLPRWVTLDRFSPYFSGGRFRHTLTEPVRGGLTNNPGYIFRFEAEGYAAKLTRAYRPDEGEVLLDIKLDRAGGADSMNTTGKH